MTVNYLFVNLDNYQDKSLNVQGTTNSAQRWKNIFSEKKFNEINQLKNETATKENIFVELTKLILRTKENELAIFVFIGHGSKKLIPESELQQQIGVTEDDNRDEILFAYDKVIIDNELRNIFNLKKPETQLLVFIDACNANSSMNMQYSAFNNLKTKPKNELVFLASSNFEKAKILDLDNKPYSIFSYFLTEIIAENEAINYYELFTKASEKVTKENPAQHINLLYTNVELLSKKLFSNESIASIDEAKIKENNIYKETIYTTVLEEIKINQLKIK